MAADSSMGFHQGIIPSFYNQHMVSFQSGTMNNNSRGLSGTGAVGTSSNAGLFLSPNSPSNLISNMPCPTIVQAGSSSSDPFCGPMPKFKFVTGSPADWSLSELAILKEGLVRYAHEPTIMKYIKIAAMLPTKTIRDVALRCWWNMSKEGNKRRKPEDHYTGKKMRDMKLQENLDLFVRTSNNIMTVLNRMSEVPGIMCRMPPYPISINEENLNSVFQLNRMVSYGGQSIMHMKQEPRS
ncbi:hypothetical protein FCM35_KLT19907 [Carex littledalei]|uniref:DUF3755 family protein n=1 Tax=Carex littledalei TaxID=544730 RepID=A0A833VP35_9POAL|nr:hypothetical protein FCM35_KLT19907 [Carex littledalei]